MLCPGTWGTLRTVAAIDVYRALWRRRYLILILTALATAFAYYLSSSQHKEYRASTLIRIQQKATTPGDAYTSLAVGQQLAKTYAQIVVTPSIRDGIRSALGGRVPSSEINIGASPVQDLALLHIFASSRNPEVAAAVANAAPQVLRKFISETQTISDQIVTINQAGVPSSPISPRPMRTAILAFLVVLIFNCGLALLIEFFQDRLPEVEELEKAVGKPVLGTIPTLSFKPMTLDVVGPDIERPERPPPLTPTVEANSSTLRRPHQEQSAEGLG